MPAAYYGFQRRHIYLSIGVLLGIYLLGSLAYHAAYYRPFSESIRIQGDFPFARGWTLQYQVIYESTNPSCASTPKLFGLIEQSPNRRPLTARRNYSVEQKTATSYSIELPIAALTGPCSWRARSWGLLIKEADAPTLVLSAYGPFPIKSATYQCKSLGHGSVRCGQQGNNKLPAGAITEVNIEREDSALDAGQRPV